MAALPLTTIYLAGDSTMHEYPDERRPLAGWGTFLHTYLDERVKVYNHAFPGRSTKLFINEGRLGVIQQHISAGDYLLVQMGHNDSAIDIPERYTEPATEYKDFLRKYIAVARSKHATPVLITPVGKLTYVDGEFVNDFPAYCQAMKEVGKEEEVPVIDLMDLSLKQYAKVGYDEAFTYFMMSAIPEEKDLTHFTEKGAKVISRIVATQLNNLDLPLRMFINLEAIAHA